MTIPSSVVELEEGWCKNTSELNKVKIDEGNKRYKNYENDLIIGKKSIENEEFEDLIFVNRKVNNITIPSFIKRISSYSISNTLIESIIIPSNITQICKRAFYNCHYLEKIEFSKNSELKVIEKKAFLNSRIKRISIPSSVIELKEGSLMKLIETKIMEGNKNYKNQDKYVLGKTDENEEIYDSLVFTNWKDHHIQFPSFIEQIGSYSFYSSCLEKIVIPSNITCICKKAFYLSRLKMIQFQQDSQLQTIEDNAFSGSFIENIRIPKNVKYIGKSAFESCSCLYLVEFEKNSELQIIEESLFSSTKIIRITIPSHVKKICKSAFYCCLKLKTIEFSKDSELEIIENAAFGDTVIESLKIPSSVVKLEENWCSWTPKLNNVEISKDNKRYKNIKDIVVGKESIESKEYRDLIFVNRNVQSIKIPSYIERITNYSFSDSSIMNITIPNNVKEICNFAFRCCKKLRQIQFSNNSKLQTIGENAFESSALNFIAIEPQITRIRCGTFSFCVSLQKVTFPENSEAQIIESSAFNDSQIESIKIPSDIVLEEGCFDATNKLVNIKIFPRNNKENFLYFEDKMIIGKSDMKSDNFNVLLFVRRNIENITIPSFVKRIASSAFRDCQELKRIGFANISEIEKIDDHAFAYSSIESFTIPPNVSKICEGTFYDCEQLQQIEIPENSKLKSIGKFAFNSTAIQQITIPSHVTHINENAFNSCDNLHKVNFL